MEKKTADVRHMWSENGIDAADGIRSSHRFSIKIPSAISSNKLIFRVLSLTLSDFETHKSNSCMELKVGVTECQSLGRQCSDSGIVTDLAGIPYSLHLALGALQIDKYPLHDAPVISGPLQIIDIRCFTIFLRTIENVFF